MTLPVRPWTIGAFGLEVSHSGGAERVTDLVLPGLRLNPRRAHLLISTVLGKHIAAEPGEVIAAGHRLGAAVAEYDLGPVDVIGMAETATGLGHCVADALDAAVYLHSTRRAAPPEDIYAEFQENHSHATDHTIQPTDAGLFGQARPLVIVDDEISTGKTALAMIEALQQLQRRPCYVVASLIDVRDKEQRAAVISTALDLDTSVHFVSLARGAVHQSQGFIDSVCALDPPRLNTAALDTAGTSVEVALGWPSHVPEGGRHGFLQENRPQFDLAVQGAAGKVAELLDPGRPVLVVGHEELMYLPARVAELLVRSGFQTRFQSTTRSPAHVLDMDGYPLRTGWRFPACEPEETGSRFLYNGWPAPRSGGPTQLVLIIDSFAASGDLEVVEVLSAAGYDVLVARVEGPTRAELARLRGQGS